VLLLCTWVRVEAKLACNTEHIVCPCISFSDYKVHASNSSKWEQHLVQAFLVGMAFSMTANVTCSIEERRILRNPHCLSSSSDSLYLQFKSTIWALIYPCKHTNCTISLQERTFQHHYVTQINNSSIETEQRYLCRVLHFNPQNLMLISPPMTRPAWVNFFWHTVYFTKRWLRPDHFQQSDLGYKTTDSKVVELKSVYVSKCRMHF